MTPQVNLVTQQYQTTTYDVLIYKVTTKRDPLRLRSGTGTKYKILGKYKKGTQVIVLNKTTSSWYEVTCPDGKHGYMASEYLTYVRTDTQSTQTNVGFRNEVIEARQLRDQPFRIYRVVPKLDKVTVYARHVFYDLLDNMIKKYEPSASAVGASVAQNISSSCLSEHDFTFYSDLTSTAEEVCFENVNPVEAILGEGGVTEKYGAELARDWFDVFLVKRVGNDTDVQIREKKNLTGISYDVDETDVVTRIMPTGEDADGNILYLPELYIDSPNIGAYYTDYICEKSDWEFVRVYADRGITGTSTKKREQFNDMIEDALAGKIDLIITKSVSRFARNTVDSLTTIRLLKEHGVEVYFEEQNIYTLDSKGELLLTIMSSLAQEESRNISENVTWGQRKRFADGKVSMPYKHFLGYRKGENGEPEIVPEEAEIVRRIYGLFLKGQTPYGIKTILEAEGIPTPAGKKTWQTATILSILTNEKYKGDALLQKTFCTDFLTKKMKVNEGEVPQYYVENSHPAIVTDEVFNMVQEEIERRRQAGRQHNGTSCFAGRIFCGCCGEMYGSKVWHSTDKYRRVIWQCNAKFKDDHHCGTPHLTEAEIQQRFLQAFNRLLDERTFILEDTAAIMEQLTATAELEAKAENLREEMDIVSELIRQAIEQNASMTMDQAEFEQRYQRLSERFQRAADHLKSIEAECARRAHKQSELETFLKNLRSREMPIEEFDAMLWMSMVKRVMVEVDGSIRFTFANEMEIIV